MVRGDATSMLVGRTHVSWCYLSRTMLLLRGEKSVPVSITPAGRDGASRRVGGWVWVRMVRDVLTTKPRRSGGFLRICVFLVVTCAAAAYVLQQHHTNRRLFVLAGSQEDKQKKSNDDSPPLCATVLPRRSTTTTYTQYYYKYNYFYF